MSRSQPTLTNPARRFFKWSGSTGKVVYYDKEKKEEIVVKLPFTFLVLDQLATITGFAEQDSSSYWSNEVRNIGKDELNIRTSKGTKYVGLYKSSQGLPQVPQGARYAKSIYIAYEEDGELHLGNFKAVGAALTAWIEFGNSYVVMNGKVAITGSEEAKKGATKYFVPVFAWDHSTSEEDEKAVSLDKELQVYLSQYLDAATHDREHVETDDQGHTIDALPVRDINDDEPINLDDIPF
jgi:hypothetical protein